jgi:SAM-dependent methyltransferase
MSALSLTTVQVSFMDLKEFDKTKANRHPWETARLRALSTILRPHLFNGVKILDVGCGDGFISRGLFSHLQIKEITAVDVHLSDKQLLEFNNSSNQMAYMRELPDSGTFDLVLLLDVLEHVKDDAIFFSDIVRRHMSKGDKILLTVPAFQSIYGYHDVNLGHYRRYNLNELESLAISGGIKILSSGYLFASLLLPKYFLCKLFNIGRVSEGVGQWTGGRYLTYILNCFLNIDNSLLLFLSRIGIKLPGLTGWVLCEKQQ